MYKIKFQKGNELKFYTHALNHCLLNKIYQLCYHLLFGVMCLILVLVWDTAQGRILWSLLGGVSVLFGIYCFIINLYVNLSARKELKKVNDFGKTEFVTENVVKIKEKSISYYYSKNRHVYLIIYYIRLDDGNVRKYYYILRDPYLYKAPEEAGEYNIVVYKNSAVIKKFETWKNI